MVAASAALAIPDAEAGCALTSPGSALLLGSAAPPHGSIIRWVRGDCPQPMDLIRQISAHKYILFGAKISLDYARPAWVYYLASEGGGPPANQEVAQ